MHRIPKRIVAVSGIRSEYDLMFPLLKMLDLSDDFDVSVVVTGAHLTPIHNYSFNQIKLDKIPVVAEIPTVIANSDESSRVQSCAELLFGLSKVCQSEQPDYLLTLGDREEPLVTALAGNYLGIPTIHLAGGDSTTPDDGNVDEQVRHATTKLSHIHLTMNQRHSERILKMGEEDWRVYTVGSGGVDRIRETAILSRDRLSRYSKLNLDDPYAVLIHHPLNGDHKSAISEINAICRAAESIGIKLVVGHPNSDPGSDRIIDFIRTKKTIQTYQNLSRVLFVNLIRHAEFLIGNSSLAFHEADYLGIPAVNVGERQRGREHSGQVLFCGTDEVTIREAMTTVMRDSIFRAVLQPGKSLYGDGYMAEKAINILRSLPDRKKLLAKKHLL